MSSSKSSSSQSGKTDKKVAHGVIFMDTGKTVEDAPKADFVGTPRSERAQVFVSKILQH